MSICIGCGLEVDGNGVLKVKLKPSGGIACDDTGLSVTAVPTAPGEPGSVGGVPLGCGLTTAGGTLNLDIGTAATCGSVVRNALECVADDGLRADEQSTISSNSLICGQPSSFIESPNLPFNMNAGNVLFLHTPVFQVKPDCTDPAHLWAGITLFDVGGLYVSLNAGSLVRVSFDLHQAYAPAIVTFGGLNPSFRNTLDNRTGTGVREQDISLHDTTFQSVAGGQTLEFQLRLRVEMVQGSGRLDKFTEQQWEATWHYTPAFGNFDGCP